MSAVLGLRGAEFISCHHLSDFLFFSPSRFHATVLALVFAQQKSLGSSSIRAPYIKQGKINMHPFSRARRAPLLDHSMVTWGACRRASQERQD